MPFDDTGSELIERYQLKEMFSRQQKLSFYEKLCKFSHRIIKLRAPKFLREKLSKSIYMIEMQVTPDEVFSLTIFSFILSFLVLLPLAIVDVGTFLIFLIFPPFIAYNALTYPIFKADVIRIKAGNETVSIILNMVTYLSFNPVYEKAVQFSAAHSHGPIGNDFKKIIWGVELGIFPSVKDGIARYSEKWNLWNEDFVNALLILQMIEVEPSQEKRNEIMETAVEEIIKSSYKKTEEYAFGLKIPSLILLLLGITLPLMGLVMFPIISIFLTQTVNPFYIAIGYTIILPFFLWWFLYRILSRRPSTFSVTEKIERVEPKKYVEIKGIRIPIIPLAIVVGIVIATPGLMYFIRLHSIHSYIFSNYPPKEAQEKWAEFCLVSYSPQHILLETFQAMFIIWGVGIGIGLATYLRSNEPYRLDEHVRKLESEFVSGLYELQGAMRQNVPVESAILKVIDNYRRLHRENTPIARFFIDIYNTLTSPGVVSIKEALFGEMGVLAKIPSSLVKNVMTVISSAFSHGPKITSTITRNVSKFLSRLEEIEHLIKKLMEDIVSNLRMQGEFIGPIITGIVGSSAVVIIMFLQKIAEILSNIEKLYNLGNVATTTSVTLEVIGVDLRRILPPTIMEIIAGMYLVEIIVIVGMFIAGISRGFSEVYRDYIIFKLMIMGLLVFTFVFFGGIIAFLPVASQLGV